MAEDLTDVDEFTEAITVPEPGDDRKVASIVPAFQGLANRTRNIKNRVDAIDEADHDFTGQITLDGTTIVNGDIFFHGALTSDSYLIFLQSPTAYWRSLPTYTATIEGNGSPPYVLRSLTAVIFAGTAGANAYLYGEIELPHGTSFDSIRFGYHPTADNDTLIKVFKYTLDTVSGNGAATQVGSTLTIPAGSALGVFTVSFGAETIDNSTTRYIYSIDCGDQVAASKASLQWVQVHTTDHYISSR